MKPSLKVPALLLVAQFVSLSLFPERASGFELVNRFWESSEERPPARRARAHSKVHRKKEKKERKLAEAARDSGNRAGSTRHTRRADKHRSVADKMEVSRGDLLRAER